MSTVTIQTKMIMITKEKFLKYLRVQRSGVINMLDIDNGTRLSGLSEDDYTNIIWNYSKYSKEFLEK
jgi:hypothetical protein